MLATTQQEVCLLNDVRLQNASSMPAEVIIATRGESALDRAKLSDDGSNVALVNHVAVTICAARHDAEQDSRFDLTEIQLSPGLCSGSRLCQSR